MRTAEGQQNELLASVEREQHAHAEVESAAHRAAFLSEASWLLADPLDLARILDQLTHLCVPTLADWCSFHLLDTRRQARLVAVAATDRHQEEWARSFLGERHALSSPDGIGAVVGHARSVAVDRPPESFLIDIAPPAERQRTLQILHPHSLVYAPLAARGCCFGALLLMQSETDRPRPDQTLVEELAARAALAIDNVMLYDKANEAIRARDEFISIASHELRTPLTVLKLAFERLLSTVERQNGTSEEVEKIGSAIRSSLHRFRLLVDSLFDVRHFGDVDSTLVLQSVDLAAIVHEVCERFRPAAERARCVLQVRGIDSPLHGSWDPIRVDQILTNLLTNALKFGRGKPVEVVLEPDDRMARITVRDHGVGISPEALERIFERFERAAPASYGGLGLGLFIARQLAEAHGGHLHVSSCVGEGATFVVELPRQSVHGRAPLGEMERSVRG